MSRPSPASQRKPASPRAYGLRGQLRVGALLSLLLHGAAVAPLVVLALVLGARQQTEREQLAEDSVDVRWEHADPDSLPDDLPDIDPQKPKPKKKPQDDSAVATLPEKPEPEPVVEVPPPEELPPLPEQRPPELQRFHEKLVELDMGKDVPPPPDAKYLAQKNNRAEQETRARDTNLERESRGTETASEASDRQDSQAGSAEERIAQFDNQQSRLGRQAPDIKPENDPSLQRQDSLFDRRRSVLAMREAIPQRHAVTPETADPSLPRDPDGLYALPEESLRSMRDMSAQSGSGARTRLRLTGNEMDYLFGQQIEADRRLAEQRRSQKQGRFTRHLGRVTSALENFVPEVQAGNQTALNTRAAPFAAYLAGMHRRIHELWGFGFLSDLDAKSMAHPMNNRDLWTRLEIVLGGDGTVDNVKVIRSSGLTTFDVAAVDVIYSASPYPDPPTVIRSTNGKIYLHWSFHRDERQCTTAGADYYILDNPPAGTDQAGRGLSQGQPPVTPPGAGRHTRKLEQLSRGGGSHHHPHPHDDARGAHGLTRAGAEPEPDLAHARRVEEERPRANDPVARGVAERFFAAFAAGKATDMVKVAGFPFHAQAGVAARTAGELMAQFSSLIGEVNGSRRLHSLNLHTSAGLRAAVGWAPPDLAADPRLLFAVALVGGDTLIAVLTPHMGGFKVSGLLRR